MWVCNLFAYRSPSPKVMKMMEDPVGEWNDAHISRLVLKADLIVCGWGNDGAHRGRSGEMRRMLSSYKPHCLAITKHGEPVHPLYQRGDIMPQRMAA